MVRFCLRRSLKLQEIIEATKGAMLEVAQEEQRKSNSEASVSRLSIMTGIHRGDVIRLSNGAAEKQPLPNIITRVIGQWRSDRRFHTADGRPRVLEFDSKTSEFASLVKSVSHDLNPYTVLFELERIEAVERTNRGLKLVAKNLILKEDAQAAFKHLSLDADDLISSVEENVFQVQPIKNLHLKTEYDKVGKKNLEKIRKWFLVEGSAFHDRARNFLSQFDQDINPSAKKDSSYARIAISTFSRVEEEEK